MLTLHTNAVLVAADVNYPANNGSMYRRLTVVDQDTGRTSELDVDGRVNGELDGILHKVCRLELSYAKQFPRERVEGQKNRPYTVVRVTKAHILDAAA
jgi:hypothetical protein